MSIKKLVRTFKPLREVTIELPGGHHITAQPAIPPNAQEILNTLEGHQTCTSRVGRSSSTTAGRPPPSPPTGASSPAPSASPTEWPGSASSSTPAACALRFGLYLAPGRRTCAQICDAFGRHR